MSFALHLGGEVCIDLLLCIAPKYPLQALPATPALGAPSLKSWSLVYPSGYQVTIHRPMA